VITAPAPLPGARLIAGVDEVGRGPLAGPVVAAAVILLRPIDGLADSKLLDAPTRERLAMRLREVALIGVAAASVDEIERINILHASMLAMRRAVLRLGCLPDLALVDGNRAPDLPCPTDTVVSGDRDVPVIGAASIVAKVVRDRLMQRLAARYPGYGWETNVGYPTSAHRDAVRRLGVTRHHRRSFATVRTTLLAWADLRP
jgi:ribonuclease HII